MQSIAVQPKFEKSSWECLEGFNGQLWIDPGVYRTDPCTNYEWKANSFLDLSFTNDTDTFDSSGYALPPISTSNYIYPNSGGAPGDRQFLVHDHPVKRYM